MFKDTVEINTISGNGGYGSVQMYGTRPIGGDGGDGGNVILKGTTSRYDLSHLSPSKPYKAKDGIPGSTKRRRGTKGEDLIIEVPLTTEVYDGKDLLFQYVLKSYHQHLCLRQYPRSALADPSILSHPYIHVEELMS